MIRAHVFGGGPLDGLDRVAEAWSELIVSVGGVTDAEVVRPVLPAEQQGTRHRYVTAGVCRRCGALRYRYVGEHAGE